LDDAQKRRGEDRALLFVLPKQARVRRPTTRPRLVLRERELEAGRECRKQAKAALIDVVVENGALYLGRFSYTTDAMKALINQPQDRSAAAREVADSLGGKLLGFWFAFGEFDGVFLMEAPDNASAAALAMAVGAGGALSEIETTVLLDMDEAQDAMRKAAAAAYRPPGS
jgi:uncharacterized protein with GYD domain